MAFATVATFRDNDGKMRIVLYEREIIQKDHGANRVITLPGLSLPLFDGDDAIRELANWGFKTENVIFMSSAYSPVASVVTAFYLAPEVTPETAEPLDNVHVPVIVSVNSWLSEQTHRNVIIATNVWAGLYLRIAHLTGYPVDGPMQ